MNIKTKTQMIKLKELLFGKSDCGCDTTMLKETKLNQKINISENLKYHLDNKIPLGESVFRISSNAHVKLFAETRKLWEAGKMQLSEADEYFMHTDAGRQGRYGGKLVPLDLPYIMESEVEEAKKPSKKKNPPLNKPKRGGPKAYFVYVKDPKTKKIKKVTFGSGGLRAKISNKEASQAFAKRHKCDQKKDRTKASYWSCNLPRYAKQLGLGEPSSRYW
jgi:hypothetical protein